MHMAHRFNDEVYGVQLQLLTRKLQRPGSLLLFADH